MIVVVDIKSKIFVSNRRVNGGTKKTKVIKFNLDLLTITMVKI